MATDYDTYKARAYILIHTIRTKHINYKSWLTFSVHLVCLALAMRQAKTVRHILGLGSTRSSGRAYTRAPILRDMEMAYLALLSIVCAWRSKDNLMICHDSKHAFIYMHSGTPLTATSENGQVLGSQINSWSKKQPFTTKTTSVLLHHACNIKQLKGVSLHHKGL